MNDTTMTKQILLTRRSPAYWRVMINHPPLNIALLHAFQRWLRNARGLCPAVCCVAGLHSLA
jgi:hypothetical protein